MKRAAVSSPFEFLRIDTLNAFLLDYMHAICLGLMKPVMNIRLGGGVKKKSSYKINPSADR